MSMLTIFQAQDIHEAHIVAGMLEAEGIRAHVRGHFLQGGVGELAGLDFAAVQVDATDAERARHILQNYGPAPSIGEQSPATLWPELRTTLTLVGAGALAVFALVSLWLSGG